MTQFYAQPYDISATGFYFEDVETYEAKISSVRNDYGQPVEEFEIQFIDGEAIDCALCTAIGLHQGSVQKVFDLIDTLDDHEKLVLIIAVGECGYAFDPETCEPSDFDVDIYHAESMKALAEQFVDEGSFGEIPEHLAHYIDFEAIARDLAVDFTETEIAGQRLIYACR
jgi:antirestriction protein